MVPKRYKSYFYSLSIKIEIPQFVRRNLTPRKVFDLTFKSQIVTLRGRKKSL